MENTEEKKALEALSKLENEEENETLTAPENEEENETLDTPVKSKGKAKDKKSRKEAAEDRPRCEHDTKVNGKWYHVGEFLPK